MENSRQLAAGDGLHAPRSLINYFLNALLEKDKNFYI